MPSNNLDTLKLALQKVEQTPDANRDPEAAAELKKILVSRIAKLELVRAIEFEDTAMPTNVEIVRVPFTDDEAID
jgi:hypothetical protein